MRRMFWKSSGSVAATGQTLLATFLYASVREVVLGGGSSGKVRGADKGLWDAALLAEQDLMEEGEGLSMEPLVLVITEITLTLAMWPLRGQAGI
jgi:hypothetical protein